MAPAKGARPGLPLQDSPQLRDFFAGLSSRPRPRPSCGARGPGLVPLPSCLTHRVALLGSVKHLFTKQVTEHCHLKIVITEPYLPWSWVAITAPFLLLCTPMVPPQLPTGPLMWGPHFLPPLSPLSPRACPAGTWAGYTQASCVSFSKPPKAAAVIPVSSEEPEVQGCGEVPEYSVRRRQSRGAAGGLSRGTIHIACPSCPQRASPRQTSAACPGIWKRHVFPPLSWEASLQQPCPGWLRGAEHAPLRGRRPAPRKDSAR